MSLAAKSYRGLPDRRRLLEFEQFPRAIRAGQKGPAVPVRPPPRSARTTSRPVRPASTYTAATYRWLCLLAVLPAGCGDDAAIRPGDIRSYTIPRPPAVAVVAPRPAEPGPQSGGLKLSYDVPEGWTDRGGGGLRLATLVIGDPAAGREVTVIPAAGRLRSNVERWQGQLGETDVATRDKAVEAALAAAEKLDVGGTEATVVLLLDAEATKATEQTETAGQAILGAMIPLDESAALFVKYKGDAAVARRERDNFNRFVSSIRWQEKQ